uniref:CSON014464 protein n=1 Tax=Culicoides sonorensis TaxID=179676 RepID=A0A336KQD2_CULSO
MALRAIQLYETTSFEFSKEETTPTKAQSLKSTKKKVKKHERDQLKKERHRKILKQCVCKNPCFNKISKDTQVTINEDYWNADFRGKKEFIKKYVSKELVQSRRACNTQSPKKSATFKYELTDESGVKQTVCRSFFLNSLGFDKSNNKLIYAAFPKNNRDILNDNRGKHKRDSSLRDEIKSHIMSFEPEIAHYRREHAPQRLYLPSDLSAATMYNHYKETHRGTNHAKYRLYTQMIRELNISFAKLGIEECEVCAIFKIHENASGHSRDDLPNFDNCVQCELWFVHNEKAKIARLEYKRDKEIENGQTIVYAVDLQKVVFLPRMDSFKEAIFAPRIKTFNETFAEVGGGKVVAVLWNESISGRKSEDILSTFDKVLNIHKNDEKVVFWLDNCTGQNKNWSLFIHICLIVNSKQFSIKQVEFKFFEAGHTFMAADSFHHQVEKSMKKYNNGHVVTFDDFVKCVKSAKKTGQTKVIELNFKDFFMPTITLTQYYLNKLTPRPKIDDIKHVIFKKGSYQIDYCDRVNGENFIQMKIIPPKDLKKINLPKFNLYDTIKRKHKPDGIDAEKKKKLLKLTKLMNESDANYYVNLPES